LRPRDIVVIGGSAGSIGPLKLILRSLPSDFPASIFVVVHISADSPTMLATLLSNASHLSALHPQDHEKIQHRHVYIARPDHHLTIEGTTIRVLRGPRENRHRPAIDPLFRTAAREYGPRVIGVVLSGLLDDGSAGLYAIKQRGGVAIAQDPSDAVWKSMPSHAIEYAKPQHVLPAGDIASLLSELVRGREGETTMPRVTTTKKNSSATKNHKPKSEAALGKADANRDAAYVEESEGTPSVFACPECHGVLWELKDGKMVRFRCRVGHSFGTESLRKELSTASESALWAAVRALEEKSAFQRRLSETMGHDKKISSRLIDQSSADATNANLIRDMIFQHDSEMEIKNAELTKKSGKKLESQKMKAA
jgi:two-component system, chemotaxis family, protein-glutamate methylesterase/glutaminase